MNWLTLCLLTATSASPAQAPAAELPPTSAVTPAEVAPKAPGSLLSCLSGNDVTWNCPEQERPRFGSDRAFDGFIGPITNPVLSKDPRSLTEARFLFIQNAIDPQSPLGGGNFQAYGLQLRLAVTDRLTLIADKDGYAVINPDNGASSDGWLNLAAGFKYVLIRDVDNQFLTTVGMMFEPQTGESEVFQGHGDGLFTLFTTVGKQVGTCGHLLGNFGYQVPVDGDQNSSFFYTSLHADRQCFGWLYPLVELNWFHWVAGGERGLPPALGEGDGLLNLGTSGVAGNDLVTLAFGLKAKVTNHWEAGAAWEFPISNRHDLLNSRLTAEVILRY